MTSNRTTKFQEILLTGNEDTLERLSGFGERVMVGHNINNPLQAKDCFSKIKVELLHKRWQKVSLHEGLITFEEERRINQKYIKILIGWSTFNGFF
jgi:hypothetical protein